MKCWFCRRDRHNECMKEIPTDVKTCGPHECTFSIKLVTCECNCMYYHTKQ